jgi:hypothetical protein
MSLLKERVGAFFPNSDQCVCFYSFFHFLKLLFKLVFICFLLFIRKLFVFFLNHLFSY